MSEVQVVERRYDPGSRRQNGHQNAVGVGAPSTASEASLSASGLVKLSS